jgi:CoA:oxalate CoA-transferase
VKPLEGLKVLDFTRVLSGPYCTAMLADLGADVIKVEPPAGDDYRHIGPFLPDASSSLFESVNRGKRSLVLDLAKDEDREIATALARSADVLVENFRPGVAAKLGLGADAMREANPRLVYASISGFGQTGPMAGLPAYDSIVQAMSGLMSVTGEPAGPPTLIGESVADVVSGIFAAFAIMAALHQRTTTGRGQHVDVAMLDAMLALQPLVAARLFQSGKAPERVGNRHPISAPFGAFKASDGMFMLAVLNDKLLAALAEVSGKPEITSNPDFKTDALRFAHESGLRALIEDWSGKRTVQEVVAALQAAGVPSGPVLNAAEAQELAALNGRAAWQSVAHGEGTIKVPEQPIRFSGAQRGGLVSAPRLDQHGEALRHNPTQAWRRT